MTNVFRLSRLTVGSISAAALSAGIVSSVFVASKAQAILPVITPNGAPGNSYTDCGQAGETLPAGQGCLNGAGATFPFPVLAGPVAAAGKDITSCTIDLTIPLTTCNGNQKVIVPPTNVAITFIFAPGVQCTLTEQFVRVDPKNNTRIIVKITDLGTCRVADLVAPRIVLDPATEKPVTDIEVGQQVSVPGFPPVNCGCGVGLWRSFFPDRFNYASRGSSCGITAFLAQAPAGLACPLPAGQTQNTPTTAGPFVFGLSDAPLSQAQLSTYYNRLPGDGPEPTTYGGIAFLPYVGGTVVSLHYSPTGPSARPGIGPDGLVDTTANSLPNRLPVLTRNQLCDLYNGNLPQVIEGVTYAQGVRRTDGSGTTFAFTHYLSLVCTPLGKWQTATGQNRGVGQVSVNEPGPNNVCLNPASSRPNTVCWPSTFTSGSGNPGVATVVNAAPGRFGYVEFATAAQLTDGAVDTDLVLANNTAPRQYPNTNIAAVQNAYGLTPAGANKFAPPLATNGTNALLAVRKPNNQSTAYCRFIVPTVDPNTFVNAAGATVTLTSAYPITAVTYLLAYGDYAPGPNGPTGGGEFGNRGAYYAATLRSLVTNFVTNSNYANVIRQFGYVPLPFDGADPDVLGTVVLDRVNGTGDDNPDPNGSPCIDNVPGAATNPLDSAANVAP
jgi:ABC-type phosphate transport system substrate-binding protein